jgi:putative transposase
LYKESHQVYGSPKIHAGLKDEGYSIGWRRVAQLMREGGYSGGDNRTYSTAEWTVGS